MWWPCQDLAEPSWKGSPVCPPQELPVLAQPSLRPALCPRWLGRTPPSLSLLAGAYGSSGHVGSLSGQVGARVHSHMGQVHAAQDPPLTLSPCLGVVSLPHTPSLVLAVSSRAVSSQGPRAAGGAARGLQRPALSILSSWGLQEPGVSLRHRGSPGPWQRSHLRPEHGVAGLVRVCDRSPGVAPQGQRPRPPGRPGPSRPQQTVGRGVG